MDSAYTGKPLATKLGIKPGMSLIILSAPKGYEAVLGALPLRVRISTRSRTGAEWVQLFSDRRARLERRMPLLVKSLSSAGALWICWPKATSGVGTDLNEDRVREIGLRAGVVDVKICSVDETWSALKFVRRLADR